LIGWPIIQKERWTRDRLTMSFLSFEDEMRMYEAVIFPRYMTNTTPCYSTRGRWLYAGKRETTMGH
jgi:hypothetical protein